MIQANQFTPIHPCSNDQGTETYPSKINAPPMLRALVSPRKQIYFKLTQKRNKFIKNQIPIYLQSLTACDFRSMNSISIGLEENGMSPFPEYQK